MYLNNNKTSTQLNGFPWKTPSPPLYQGMLDQLGLDSSNSCFLIEKVVHLSCGSGPEWATRTTFQCRDLIIGLVPTAPQHCEERLDTDGNNFIPSLEETSLVLLLTQPE